MPLTAGTRLGPYEIHSALGAGGMGEVYRARDTTLNRDVAIKVLPELFAADADRLARFTREAQTLASLNHPNIAQIYGLDEVRSGGPLDPPARALVMELVEGQDLSEIIARPAGPQGPALHLNDVLAIARQIAEALEAAHDAGIVHRDLKPANVKIKGAWGPTPTHLPDGRLAPSRSASDIADGAVKVLDFGLAKAVDRSAEAFALHASGVDAANSPTLTARATQMGMIIGTAAYMSPEQARGKAVDKRADIWAFGVVVYEMLTGSRAFKGDEISDVLAAVLRQDIDWTTLPKGTPPRLRRLLERCLDRDQKTRLRDIGEARVELAKIESGAPDTVSAPLPSSFTPRPRYREAIAWSIAGAAIAAAATLLFLRPSATAPNAAVVRLSFVPPAGVTFEAGRTDAIVVSPDGRLLVFTGRSTDGKRQLYVRSLDGIDIKLLQGTEDALRPFWSPDSKSVAFGAQGKLKRVDIAGGRPAILADAPRLNGGAWSRAGVIIFVPDYNAGALQVSDRGGAAKVVITPDAARQQSALITDPAFLPDGVHFVYGHNGGAEGKAQVRLGSLSAPDTTFLLDGAGARFVAPDRLLFERTGTLFASAFDPDRLVLRGDPIPLIEPANEDHSTTFSGEVPFSVSDSGVLVRKNGFMPDYQLVWFDRQGRSLGTVGPSTRLLEAFAPRLSPDGTRVAIQDRSGTDRAGLWVIDLQRDLPTRVSSATGQYPQWSADGRQIAWVQRADGVLGIYQKAATGLGSTELLVRAGSEAGSTTFPNDWSKDGRFILYHTRGEKTRVDVWALPLFGDRKPHPVLNTEFDDGPAQLSPDGRWLAYRSDSSGTYEIYMQSFTSDGQAGSERVRISTNGGNQPRFRPDGRELFYLADDGRLMAVALTTRGATLEHGEPKALFKTRTLPRIVDVQFEYDVTRDGQRFLMGTILDGPHATPPPPTIVLNWMAELKK